MVELLYPSCSVAGVYFLTLVVFCSAFKLDLVEPAPSTESQYDALVDLFNSTNGNQWKRNANWLKHKDYCSWYGVLCSSNRYVVDLLLEYNKLSGTIPPSIGQLTSLEKLDLNSNQLSGTIPSSIGQLTSLRVLLQENNQLSGTIPPSIGQLIKLQILQLNNNQLTGPIPASIGQLYNLELLLLQSNQLTGTLPSSIGHLISLKMLYVSYNQLSGTIPASIGQLAYLQRVILCHNRLTGVIPESIGQAVYIDRLDLSGNLLSGTIPLSVGQIIALSDLDISNNSFTDIPKNLTTIYPWSSCAFQNNQFICPIPEWTMVNCSASCTTHSSATDYPAPIDLHLTLFNNYATLLMVAITMGVMAAVGVMLGIIYL